MAKIIDFRKQEPEGLEDILNAIKDGRNRCCIILWDEAMEEDLTIWRINSDVVEAHFNVARAQAFLLLEADPND